MTYEGGRGGVMLQAVEQISRLQALAEPATLDPVHVLESPARASG